MARAIWSGSLSFGLVNVPVGLYSATQDHEVRFHQFQKGTATRIKHKRVNEKTGREVDYEDIVKGAEVGDGKYVMLTSEDLESVEPGRSRTIDISDFVEASEIDPIYFQKSYYLAPKDDSAKKAYSLLVKALEKGKRIGIDQLPTGSRVQPKDLKMAVNLIEAMTSKWDPKNYEEPTPPGSSS